MQQLFPQESGSSGAVGDLGRAAAARLTRFKVPEIKPPLRESKIAVSGTTSSAQRGKRSRSSAAQTEDDDKLGLQRTVVKPARQLSADELHAVQRTLEYGACGVSITQPAAAGAGAGTETCFSRITTEAAQRSHPFIFMTSQQPGAACGASDDPASPYGTALRRALSLICRVVSLDPSGHYLERVPAPNTVSGATTQAASCGGSGTLSSKGVSLLELYCSMQALELELDDLCVSRATGGAVSSPVAAESSETLREIECTVVACVNALEETIIDVLLFPIASGTGVPRAYLARVAAALPSVFQQEMWPCGLLLGSRSEDSCTGALGGGITAIVMHAMRDTRNADTCGVLGMSSAPSLTVLAAELLSSSSRGSVTSGGGGDVIQAPLLDLDALSFAKLSAKAWAGLYSREGVRRAVLEVQALFCRLFLDARDTEQASTTRAPQAGAAALAKHVQGAPARLELTNKLLTELWVCWNVSLRDHYSAFLREMGGRESEAGDEILKKANVFSILSLRQCGGDGEAEPLSDTQQRTLRVLAHLSAMDADGWFAVPAFDLVNVDLASVEKWVRSRSFAIKNNRAAFNSLRRVLERIVDSCVRKYGPTHRFSECITNVRQRLVDAAKQEGLLL